ncbi:GIY-YIG nuclease family protein [Gracilimonas sp. BCB1]|uniref:GIY-YIG nuclease family protein n=1 Tax=Gracilimonas sp. BCB1 TaxID=3152362 RepID=UPI0032D910AB
MDNATYIVTNPERKVLYTGVTSSLPRRIVEHYLNRGNNKSYAGRYFCYCLIWYDVFPTMYEAIEAEKRIKGKSRAWKDELITRSNPRWKFLNEEILGEWPPRKTLPF